MGQIRKINMCWREEDGFAPNCISVDPKLIPNLNFGLVALIDNCFSFVAIFVINPGVIFVINPGIVFCHGQKWHVLQLGPDEVSARAGTAGSFGSLTYLSYARADCDSFRERHNLGLGQRGNTWAGISPTPGQGRRINPPFLGLIAQRLLFNPIGES